MSGFDAVAIVDWSAAQGRSRPRADAVWIGLARAGQAETPRHFPTRHAAARWLERFILSQRAAGRRVLVGFDFPFGYPSGFAARVTGTADPFALWDWLEGQIVDAEGGRNNRFDVAETLNARFPGIGPFWGKFARHLNPGLPYRGTERHGHGMAERRACDMAAKAASSCWQLAFPPTVGSQALTGLPVVSRLRRIEGVAVWPFERTDAAPAVLAEIWPGTIEAAVRGAGPGIRDAHQVGGLARALSCLSPGELKAMMAVERSEEGWILGAGHEARLSALAMP